MAEFRLRIRVSRPLARWGLAAILLSAFSAELSTESATVSTCYPAPSGVYSVVVATRDAYLARDSGGAVGIGTTNPQATLGVGGAASVEGNLTAGGLVSAGDAQAGGSAVVTGVSCPSGLTCARSGHVLTVSVCVSDGSCSANPSCGQTAAGVDNCGSPCTRTGVACCVPNGSCSANPPCGQTGCGVDNCGNSCCRTGPACPPPPKSCGSIPSGSSCYQTGGWCAVSAGTSGVNVRSCYCANGILSCGGYYCTCASVFCGGFYPPAGSRCN